MLLLLLLPELLRLVVVLLLVIRADICLRSARLRVDPSLGELPPGSLDDVRIPPRLAKGHTYVYRKKKSCH